MLTRAQRPVQLPIEVPVLTAKVFAASIFILFGVLNCRSATTVLLREGAVGDIDGSYSNRSECVLISETGPVHVTIKQQIAGVNHSDVTNYTLELPREHMTQLFQLFRDNEISSLPDFVPLKLEAVPRAFSFFTAEGNWSGQTRRVGYMEYVFPAGHSPLSDDAMRDMERAKQALSSVSMWISTLPLNVTKQDSPGLNVCRVE